MKNYKKGLLTLAILSAMPLMAAVDRNIYVTTFEDEDGENPAKCSLREALHASAIHDSYGGCGAGQVYSSLTNVIQLEAGEYKLTKELRPNSDVSILGKAPLDYSKINVLTNTYPAQTAIKTTISGQGKSRIFNTIYDNKAPLTLGNVILKDATSANDQTDNRGGAIYAGNMVTLNNVDIQNTNAQAGGAIYLNGIGSSLTVNHGMFQNNNAVNGSILAMSCGDNLGYTSRVLNINYSTFIKNGSNNSLNMFELCGQPDTTFTGNTLTDNIANSQTGAIIQFSKTAPQRTIGFSDNSQLKLVSNTIVKNAAYAVLLYGYEGAKGLSNNVLAYNTGKSCKYAPGDVAKLENVGIVVGNNALTLSSGNDECELPDEAKKDKKDHTLDVSTINFSTILSELQPATEYTAFVPMYFPKDLNTDADLVNSGYSGCSDADQRGMTRILSATLSGETTFLNTCDIGSTELLFIGAYNISNAAALNSSIVSRLDSYQQNIDNLNTDINGTVVSEDIKVYYRYLLENYTNLLKYTKSEQKYRALYIDPFLANTPAEEQLSNGGRNIIPLTPDNYTVQTEVMGVGMVNDKNQFIGTVDKSLHCVWNADLKQIMMWRDDDNVTPSGDNEFCKYTITTKNATPVQTSSAYIIGTFTNIAPIAKNASFDVEYGANQQVSFDLNKYASDDGDGLTSTLLNNPNKSKFYLNESGQVQALRMGKTLDPVVISAEHSGPCPGLDKQYTCYGGNITMKLKNTLDPFSYKFTYFVYDAEGLISNEATVTLANSGTAPNSVRESGGGSFGAFGVFGLLGLVAYRRYKLKK